MGIVTRGTHWALDHREMILDSHKYGKFKNGLKVVLLDG